VLRQSPVSPSHDNIGWDHDDLWGQVVHDLFLEDLALAHVISLEQSKTVIKRNRIVEEAEEETVKQG
jgi:hypothetical protein